MVSWFSLKRNYLLHNESSSNFGVTFSVLIVLFIFIYFLLYVNSRFDIWDPIDGTLNFVLSFKYSVSSRSFRTSHPDSTDNWLSPTLTPPFSCAVFLSSGSLNRWTFITHSLSSDPVFFPFETSRGPTFFLRRVVFYTPCRFPLGCRHYGSRVLLFFYREHFYTIIDSLRFMTRNKDFQKSYLLYQ